MLYSHSDSLSLLCYEGGFHIPKDTFLHLDADKRVQIELILLDVLYDQPLSQVKVSEIISLMNMSRGAFYKYFKDLADANDYLISTVASAIHIDIMQHIQQSEDALFDGIANYLKEISHLDHQDIRWKQIKFLTGSDQLIFSRRRKVPSESKMFNQWFTILEKNHLDISNNEEAISFLYFVMSLVTNSLTEFIANEWDSQTLLLEYNRKISWLLHGLNNTKGE